MGAKSKAFCIYIRSSMVGQLAGWEEAAKEDKDIIEQPNELFALVPAVNEVGVFHTGSFFTLNGSVQTPILKCQRF